jgi:tRNA(Ile)-lysidine synthase
MENLLQRFQQYVKKEHLFSSSDKLLIAVSGGVDSMVLCDLCYRCGYAFEMVHCNFQLRGEESMRDEAFVLSSGKKYGKDVLLKRFDTKQYAETNKLSIQEAARKLRYEWFEELISSNSSTLNYLLTAHHADDNIETLLMNFFRGTGIQGLHGILPKQQHIVRPLLFASKEELLVYANENQLSWVEDSSNQSSKYTRNYFRNELIPQLQKVFPSVKHHLTDNINRFREIEIIYRQSVEWHKKKLLEQKGNELYIPILKLRKTAPLNTILYEIISDYNFSADQVKEVIQLMDADNGSYIASASHRIIKHRNWLIISSLQAAAAAHVIIDSPAAHLQFADGSLAFTILPANSPPETSNHIAYLDADLIRFPLILRKWKAGDYFYPLGMRKKKKLARFFIDQKLSRIEKEKVWVLEMDHKIIWVVGYRIDDRFKVGPATKNILKITQRVS